MPSVQRNSRSKDREVGKCRRGSWIWGWTEGVVGDGEGTARGEAGRVACARWQELLDLIMWAVGSQRRFISSKMM